MTPKPARSDSYQHLWHEFSADPQAPYFLNLETDQALYPTPPDAQLLELTDQLIQLMWQVGLAGLTPKQQQVLQLKRDGYTQWEIADALGIHQTSVHKALFGNQFAYRGRVKCAGGMSKKLLRLWRASEPIRQLAASLHALDEGLGLLQLLRGDLSVDNFQDWLETPLDPHGIPQWQVDILHHLFSQHPRGVGKQSIRDIKQQFHLTHKQYTQLYRYWKKLTTSANILAY